MSNIIKDLTSFTHSKFGHGTAEVLRDMVNGRGGFKNYISPTIIEERSLNVAQMDVFSRLMMDRIIFFGTEVTSETANVVVSQLLYLDQVEPGQKITMYVNSPGGECYSGMGLLDVMNFVDSPVATTCTGLAASMGAMILMNGEKGMRSALPLSRVMVHQPLISGGVGGCASDIQITAQEILKLKDELFSIISRCTGKSIDEIRQDNERDHWFTAKEALDYGLIDEVITKKAK